MGNPVGSHSTPPEILRQLQSLIPSHTKPDGKPNVRRLAEAMGCERSTVLRYLRRIDEEPAKPVEFPSFVTEGDEDEDISEILDRKAKHFERKFRAAAERSWFAIKVNETRPYGVLCFGDVHLDDDGCNVPLLKRHLEIASRPGVYSVNIGDSSNNWVGRLERLYGHQEASKHTGRRLVEWLMFGSGASWLCWILGNHDTWNEGADFHLRLAKHKIPVIDWRAQFQLVHPSGTTCRLDASHGRKGSSIWNNLHATLRSARLGELADAYLTGHTHNYGSEDLEIAERRHSTWLVQLRGYKFFDDHALHSGFAEYQRGSAVMLIVDPTKDAKRAVVQCFDDVDLGYRVLEMLRAA
jgi:hypothetical protein